MALNPHKRRPLRVLAGLAGITVVLLGLLFGANTWGSGQWTPKLGLDLEGGTQMVLEPVLVGTNKVSSEQLNQARDIIVQRVDANGVAGAEVTTRGGRNIVVSMPGQPTKATEEAIRKSSQMRFRPVIVAGAGMPQPTPTTTPSGTATGKPTGSATPSKAPVPTATGATTTAAKSGLPQALLGSTTAPTPAATTAAATSKPAATATASPTSAAPAGKPANASDPKWITEDIAARYKALECTPGAADKIVDDPAKPLVTCSADGLEKFILGPVEVRGDEIKNAVAGYQPLSNGQPSSTVEIQLSFNDSGTKHFADVTKRLVSLPEPRNRFAVTLDSKVLTAPTTQAAILNGQASITGGFTIESARDLANQLKFGALPMSFTLETQDTISPQLGGDQLQRGLLAGAIGLLLVVIYSLFQYRALGLVTVSSLVIASIITYGVVTLFGWAYGFRLTMAGVTGLIVAIGITADSFILYFERVRDEVRDGRPLRAAVESGWVRARRTILISDAVNFLAAVVLYVLAASNVRGFAFTLMLTTIIDIIVVLLFTHPLLTILANTKFFGEGHKWSGLDPERLGARTITYAGRGRVSIASQRAAAAEGTQS
jgi:preprotein translocase subunit SecD